MPSWGEVLHEMQSCTDSNQADYVRRKYMRRLSDLTGRNVIAYYSGFLQKPGIYQGNIIDLDKDGFMNAIYKLDRSKGLDLILHTPGGDLAAAESLVYYLKEMFGKNIRTIVPQLAMSAGTMIACASKEIIMDRHSNLGPIDPQLRGIPASGVIDEFERAYEEIKLDINKARLWQPILSQYTPTFVGECEKAIVWSKEMVTNWLLDNMLFNEEDAKVKAEKIVNYLSSHDDTKTHSRHIHIDACKEIGLKIISMKDELSPEIRDAILTVHHAYLITLSNANVIKIIENQYGSAVIQNIN